MPAKGKDLHLYLKNCASKRLINIYGSSLDYLRLEQPTGFDDANGKNYFKTTTSMGTGLYDDLKAENLNFPDIFVQVSLSEEEQKINAKKDMQFTKKFIIVECETQKTPWLTDINNSRNISYRFIKTKRKDTVFILVIFNDMNIKTDLFHRIWRFKHP